MNRTIVLLLLLAAAFVGYILWSQVQRSREDKTLHAAAMTECVKAPATEVECRNRIRRHHDECRTISTTIVSTGPKSSRSVVAEAGYADCVTRGPTVIKQERAAARQAEQERKAGVLR